MTVLNTDFNHYQHKLEEVYTTARKSDESHSSLQAKFTFVPIAQNTAFYQKNGIQSKKTMK